MAFRASLIAGLVAGTLATSGFGSFVQAQSAGAGLGNEILLEVQVACLGDAAEFRVRNAGAPWPQSATFQIMRMADQGILSKRKLRLAEGQRASFKIKNTKGGADQLGLFVDPSWYVRSFQFDAMVDCRQ